MYISQETPEETHKRLLKVFSRSELIFLPGEYAFVECGANNFPHNFESTALAFVRDSEVWSALVPSTDVQAERFTVFRFHFPGGLDNSGFVGWLAAHLKRSVGTGVFVVCGQNSKRGGIFDYWGVPMEIADKVIAEFKSLRKTADYENK